jgi:hypothetical protein
MGEQKKRKLMWLVPLVLLISLTGGVSLFSQFLSDEEEQKREEEKKPVEEKKDTAPDNIALNLKAKSVPDASGKKCTIKVTWDLNPKYPGDYIVAKSNAIIDTVEKVKTARVVMTVKGTVNNTVIDPDCAPGSYYYVVLSKTSITDNKIELFRDSNYMSTPLVVGAAEILPMVSNIRTTETNDLKVRLTWDKADKTALFYNIYRSKQVINNEDRLKQSERLETLVDKSEYIDGGVATDVPYYYAVTVKSVKGKENTTLQPDKNYTTTGAMVTARKVEQTRIKSISARSEKGGIMVAWKFSGPGEAYYRLFRSVKQVKKANEIVSRDILQNVNVADGSYLDATAPAGNYYYGLVPGSGTDLSSYVLVPGVTITRKPVGVKVKEEKKEKIEREITVTEPDDIDRILKRTFFKSRYSKAIEELQGVIDAGANEEIAAKAKLFIGRSHIELGRYRKSLDYLLLSDVKKNFPKDADFWTAFALARIRNH